jgi:hypothetical protein
LEVYSSADLEQKRAALKKREAAVVPNVILASAIEGFEAQKQRLDAQIAELQQRQFVLPNGD